MSRWSDLAKSARPVTSPASKRVGKVPVGVTSDSSFRSSKHLNFMAGTSFDLDPLATLRFNLSSSIFGSESYYESDEKRRKDSEAIIDAALSYNFEETLSIAAEMRSVYGMRLNPGVIMVRAAIHPDREAFTASHPGGFNFYFNQVVYRPDDITTMIEYYMAVVAPVRGTGHRMSRFPKVLKRAMISRLSQFEGWAIQKYANRGMGLVDVVRLLGNRELSAKNSAINAMMKGEAVSTQETWMQRSSKGASWESILLEHTRGQQKLTHGDMLTQMANISNAIDTSRSVTPTDAEALEADFLAGAAKSRFFPYQYWTAARNTTSRFGKAILTKGLDARVQNGVKLEGRVAALADNSGSARGALATGFGTAKVCDVANLNAVVAAMSGTMGGDALVFGDTLRKVATFGPHGTFSVLPIAEDMDREGNKVGGGTENGIWLFWKQAIEKGVHYDHVFIYSDQQAGQGKLYGVNSAEYRDYVIGSRNIDIYKLVDTYRKKVNPRVNVYCVQIAGYKDSVMPENGYRSANLAGWNGSEVLFAAYTSMLWDIEDAKK